MDKKDYQTEKYSIPPEYKEIRDMDTIVLLEGKVDRLNIYSLGYLFNKVNQLNLGPHEAKCVVDEHHPKVMMLSNLKNLPDLLHQVDNSKTIPECKKIRLLEIPEFLEQNNEVELKEEVEETVESIKTYYREILVFLHNENRLSEAIE